MTRLFNGSTQPRVIAWGDGVVMPGESFETDTPEGYQPDTPGSPWTTDAEASSALLSVPSPGTGDMSDSASDGHSEPQVTRWGSVLRRSDTQDQDGAGKAGHGDNSGAEASTTDAEASGGNA